MFYTAKPLFNQTTCTLLLDLEENLSGLYSADLDLEARKRGFQRKKELHITILGFKNGQIVKSALENMPDKEATLEEIVAMTNGMDWTFEVKLERFYISKGEKESIIQRVEIDSITHFFERLNEMLKTNIETPPAHLTLYTKGKDEKSYMGIGINSEEELKKLNPRPVLIHTAGLKSYTKIVLPTRPQPDTIVAIFILKKFGEQLFPGIKTAVVDFWQILPDKETEETLDKRGVVLIDLGNGKFDHHATRSKTTASNLIASYLGASEDPALAKLLEYARRDDFFGKGTVSSDPIDRTFGLSSLIAALNKSLVKNPARVIDLIFPLLIAHYNEESKRTKELPEEFEKKLSSGEAETFSAKQRDKKLKVVIVNSDSGSLAGYLRSQNGGRFDIVAQWLPSGHVNILTRPTKRIDLRSLAALLRIEEAATTRSNLPMEIRNLAGYGRIKEVPDWYYDPATNSIQNGGLNPKEINPTKISRNKFKKILELGLSEKLWDPRQ